MRIFHTNITKLFLLALFLLPIDTFAQNKLAYIVVEGLDTLHLFQPDNEAFLDRRERVAVTEDDLLATRNQSGYVGRRFADSITDIDTLFQDGEMAVVNKVGFSSPVCDHKETRKLLGRGVDRKDSAHTNGWLIRAAERHNWNTGREAWDTTKERYALSGTGYVGTQFLNFSSGNDNTRQWPNFNHVDSDIREDTIYSTQRFFSTNSAYGRSFIAQAGGIRTALTDIREGGNEPGNFNDLIEDPFGRAEYVFRNYPNSARVVVGRVPAFRFLSGNESYSFDTFRDQRDAYDRIMDNLEDGIREFVDSMKNEGIWNEVILVVVPDYGRSYYATGIIDTDRGDNDGDTRGTNCGHGGDAFVFGATSSIRGGFYGAGYTASELSSSNMATPNFTHAQLLHASLQAIGLVANDIIERDGRPALNNLFDNGF